ncbi:sensor domain-containing diguanylate cyclase [Dyella sp. OK004]|uniref:sensor domain-containing diguanylate cyclase n=1 Tax=Dyella sp. OK004 TaxID=1855292 RepID=UPI0015A6B0DA|nr:sensor domain-containing diguanylate cyclase [Dyella sp. OK004]
MNRRISEEPRFKHHTLLWEALGLFAAIFAVTSYSLVLTSATSSVVSIWIANGVVVGSLLRVSGKKWPVYLAVSLIAYLAGKGLQRAPLLPSLALGLINGLETLIVAFAVRRAFPRIADDTTFLRLGRVALSSTLVASAVSALLAAGVIAATHKGSYWPTVDWWFRAHVLGMVIVATATLVVLTQRSRMLGNPGHRIAFFRDMTLVAVTTIGVFVQSRYPLLFLVFAPLLFAVFRHHFPGLVVGVLMVALITNVATAMGTGPFDLMVNASPNAHALLAQVYLGVICLITVPVALTLADRRRLEQQIRDSEIRYRLLADYASDLVMRICRNGERRYVSPSIKDLLGWEVADFMKPHPELIHPDDRERVATAVAELWASGKSSLTQYRLQHRDGHYVWIEALVRIAPSPDNPAESELIYTGRDVTESVLAEQALADSEKRLRTITDNIPAVIAHVDSAERYTFINAYVQKVSGQKPQDIIGRTVREVRGAALYERFYAHIACALAGGEATFSYEMEGSDGQNHYLQTTYLPAMSAAGERTGFYALTTDITDIKRAEQELAYLAHYDALTGLANRRYFVDCLHLALERARAARFPLMLLIIDVDHFKSINDSYGHGTGDAVLREIAHRLKSVTRKSDVVARLGGDEFVILCNDVDATYAAEALAKKITDAMSEPVLLDSARLDVTLSIGAALCRDVGSEDELMQRADVALYRAKEAGRACYELAVSGL